MDDLLQEGWWPAKEKGQECVRVVDWKSMLASQTQHMWPRPPPPEKDECFLRHVRVSVKFKYAFWEKCNWF